ncbi:MAG: hypothetical protein ACT4PZ_01795 [Panacagrimonas sp.]
MNVPTRYLLILDAALFAMAATLATVLGVVLLMYSFHTDLSTRVGAEMPLVATVMASFFVLALFLGVAFWSLLRQRSWRWWAQIAAAVAMSFGSVFLYNQVTA